VWEQPFVDLRLPAIYDLDSDPFERVNKESIGYDAWRIERLYLLVPAQAYMIRNWIALRRPEASAKHSRQSPITACGPKPVPHRGRAMSGYGP
jgi:hypothetical protein